MTSVNPTFAEVVTEEEKQIAFKLPKKLKDTASHTMALAETIDKMKAQQPDLGRRFDAATEAAVKAAEALAILELHVHTVLYELS